MSAEVIPPRRPRGWLVRQAGNYALKFHERGVTAVADAEATIFQSQGEAEQAIERVGYLEAEKMQIEPVF